MDKELGVAVIHGMGTQSLDFAQEMIVEINDRIDGQSRESDKIAWKPIFWADLLEQRELQYFRDAQRHSKMNYLALREFIVQAIGDAAAYQRVIGVSNVYERIHTRVREQIHSLYVNDLKRQDRPLIVLAHSLGGHIMSNYIWDVQRAPTRSPTADADCPPTENPAEQPNPLQDASPFERMETLAGIITFGCNIPLFTFAYDTVEPIEFPPNSLPDELKEKAKWLNFYDADDVLGYPLKPISPEYDEVVAEDNEINAGGVLSSLTPLSHSKYWTDNDFTRPAAQFIGQFL